MNRIHCKKETNTKSTSRKRPSEERTQTNKDPTHPNTQGGQEMGTSLAGTYH